MPLEITTMHWGYGSLGPVSDLVGASFYGFTSVYSEPVMHGHVYVCEHVVHTCMYVHSAGWLVSWEKRERDKQTPRISRDSN